jgi:SOS-response transcriptional repressor LexA
MFWENFDYLSRKIGSNPNAVAAECGVKSSGSVSAWKNGTMPQKKTIEKIASYFGITTEELLGEFIPEKQKVPSGMDDAPIMRIYSALNDAGRAELERYGNYLTAQDVYQRKEAEKHIEYIRHYIVPAAAGYASPIEGEDYELIPLDPKAPRGADYCISISGDSMEPYIHDGELAYVKRGADMQPFDVGVFFVDGDVLCKQYCVDSFRNLYLLSANPAREDANRTITADSGSSVVCYGKVLLRHRLPQPVYL